MLLQVGAAAPFEYARVAQLPNPLPSLLTPGQVVLSQPLRRAYAAGTVVTVMQAPASNAARPISTLTLPAHGRFVAVDRGGRRLARRQRRRSHLTGEVMRGDRSRSRRVLPPLAADAAFAERAAGPVHHPRRAARIPPAPRSRNALPLVRVQALDTGGWGNRLRVSVADEDPGLVARTPVVTAIAPNRIRLGSAAGVERGTILELLDAASTVLTTVKVLAIERAHG